ncbi:MAG: class I SAM-dependent methyltransferase [Myxococcota bacterium]
MRVTPEQVARAKAVAERCGAPFVERRGAIEAVLAGHSLAYVVARDREWVTDGREQVRVEAGLLHAKIAAGAAHPLIRAVGPAAHVIDCTLGLAGDALHLSAVLGARVDASEASPVVYSLVEAGLSAPDPRWAEAAARIHAHRCAAIDLLRSTRADVVFLAPMFETPARAAPGYGLFRAIADHRELDPGTLDAARSAAPRVVVRVEKGAPAPEPGWHSLPGKAVDYWVWSR